MNNLITYVEQRFGKKINGSHVVLVATTALILCVFWEQLILIVGACVYLLWHIKEKEKVQQHQQAMRREKLYMDVADFLYNPIRDMHAWIDIKQPQAVKDILTSPAYVREGSYEFLSYKLLKLTATKIDEDKLAFAENALASILEDELLATYRDNHSFEAYFKDVPILQVHRISDHGSHLKLTFIIVNQYNYEFVKGRSVFPLPVDETKLPTDENF